MEYSEKPHFSIVLPAHNEGENLPDVLRDLKLSLEKAEISSEIIVVDNGSADNTWGVIETLKKEMPDLKILKIEKNIGWGNGIIKGLEMARAPILGYAVADGQVKSEAIINVYQELKKHNLDFCKGFRVNRCDGLTRAAMTKVYNLLFRLMFHCPYKDINSVPKIFTRNFYEIVKPQSKGYFIDAEILIKAKQNNLLVGEIPVVSLKRKSGSSSISVLTSFGFLKNMFYWFLFKKP